MLKAAKATCDFYIENTPIDGIPYWDTGAPNLHKLGDYLNKPADPYNEFEPVDSSAAAIGAQGLLRLGKYLNDKKRYSSRKKYWQAGLTVLNTLLDEPYLSTNPESPGAYYCILFITGPMVGIIFRKEVKFLMVNPACGAIIMHAKFVFICSGSSTMKNIILFLTVCNE